MQVRYGSYPSIWAFGCLACQCHCTNSEYILRDNDDFLLCRYIYHEGPERSGCRKVIYSSHPNTVSIVFGNKTKEDEKKKRVKEDEKKKRVKDYEKGGYTWRVLFKDIASCLKK